MLKLSSALLVLILGIRCVDDGLVLAIANVKLNEEEGIVFPTDAHGLVFKEELAMRNIRSGVVFINRVFLKEKVFAVDILRRAVFS
ncbi:hypothetical protein DGG96_14555 [Legionella qingyii]|uniref:Uncharacterized protein n=1 Tax=Legionella qingyii TaxID=2184757 RepID=A0A317U326_9GAMM|nr:hypothetical protein DGG96_14555 [Legionella qingyii]